MIENVFSTESGFYEEKSTEDAYHSLLSGIFNTLNTNKKLFGKHSSSRLD